jgi:hypothetical protein
LEDRFGTQAIYTQADAPAASIPGWWEIQWQEARKRAHGGRRAFLLIDEIQYLSDWGRRLKVEYDRILHEETPIHVVVSGSSSLRLGRGTRETMAGRFERLQLLHWPIGELMRHFSIDEERGIEIAITKGTYPGAVRYLDQPDRWRSYIRDAIVEPAIGRDIMALEAIRKPALLRQLFAVAAGSPAEIISIQKLRGQLTDPGALETTAHYLHVLEEAYLVASLEKFSPRALRRRAAPPKLVVLNQGILGAFSFEGQASAGQKPEHRGRWIENACIAHAWNDGQEVRYWRREPLEVDMILSGSWGKWAIEIKTGSYNLGNLKGLMEFSRLYPEYRPLLLCNEGDEMMARNAGINCCSWKQFLLKGPPDDE